MDIIITESQYNQLLESDLDKTKKLVYGMFKDGMSIPDIKKYTNLTIDQILFALKDYEIHIDADFAGELIRLLYLFATELVNKVFHFGDDETLKLSYGNFSGTLDFTYEAYDKEVYGFATPYWDDCETLPVDVTWIGNPITREGEDYTISDDSVKIPEEYNSISELINFLNNDYPEKLRRKVREIMSNTDLR